MNLTVFSLPIINYESGLRLQKRLFTRCLSTESNFLVLTEHYPVLTLGKGGNLSQLLIPLDSLDFYQLKLCYTDRGGGLTLHLPGQLVVYPILKLGLRYDLHFYLRQLEQVMLTALAVLGVKAHRRLGKTGVWVKDKKIGAIGIRVSHGVCYHGFSLNINNDLTYYQFIKQCGISSKVTSVKQLTGQVYERSQLESLVINSFLQEFKFKNVNIKAAKSKKASLA